ESFAVWRGRLEAEVRVGASGGAAAPRRPLQEASLEEVRLQHVLDRVRLLADRGGQRRQSHGAARERRADRLQQLAVVAVQTFVVDLQQLERGVGGGDVDR